MEATALPRGGGRIKLRQSIAKSESTAPTGLSQRWESFSAQELRQPLFVERVHNLT
jgi:hypothetical protein